MTTTKNEQPVGLPADAGVDEGRKLEQPVGMGAQGAVFGSDVIAETLRAMDIPYIALNPGASFRGLHDSLVNYLGNVKPSLLLCLHEEHAVAIAHGYAKVTGKAMAAAAHSNVGLFHATMAVFNAWCDRMPLLLIGATGPVDASHRRPWIEWIHTARDQGAIVRPYTKWDDQPASPAAASEALMRAMWLAETAPKAPVYINLDAGLQEQPLDRMPEPLPEARYRPQVSAGVSVRQARELAEILSGAERPVILAGRVSRCERAWAARIALAEGLGARVLTDLKVGAAFPTDHPLHAGAPGIYATPEALEAVRQADVILSLDWVDLAGLELAAYGRQAPRATVIQVSQDYTVHNGWSMDHQALPIADVHLAAEPDAVVAALVDEMGFDATRQDEEVLPARALPSLPALDSALITMAHLASGLREAVGKRKVSLVHLPLGWDGAFWPLRHPLDFLGSDGGGGIGGGPGISVGAALALRGTERLPVCIGGDGDFLMGATALWTAVHYRIPLLYLVANNQSFFNDEVHQERVARMRGRPVENKWIGQRMVDPEIDIAGLAQAQGALGLGPVHRADELPAILARAIAHVDAGGVAVVDVRTQPGYTPAMVASLTTEPGAGSQASAAGEAGK
ncbi:thiamine pyrophosphate-dependent acetolactate synthase large subunit-like protein [Kerstersia gyiorum]|uniref:Thiamine pyrophosphate-dependent acetolactate synthase large subunit-like protein n=1 Tax=Kerstersia gyiorum TaxID=206506 RepID=A0A4V2EZJ8_9BURK|nr:thiamine pyrophosphate-binding protein [Kerstersia gyiorum]RZS66740.1 thiamine pyrophosphate-dependent acetolactate synthase large subunit-like protein [Kerstersia gyiorum]